MAGSDTAAIALLCRAVELDGKKRKTEALVCYKEGLQLLMNVIQDMKTGVNEARLSAYRSKASQYMQRAEQLSLQIEEDKRAGKFHEQYKLEGGSTGHSYQTLFGRFLDEDVTQVDVEDPYVRAHHQIQNFLRLCELLVKSCKSLLSISLLTSPATNQQSYEDQCGKLEELKNDLKTNYKITLNVMYSETLHDREIRILPTGWVVKIGRGLDIYKPAGGRIVIGQFDTDLRPCLETTVDIFHKSTLIDQTLLSRKTGKCDENNL